MSSAAPPAAGQLGHGTLGRQLVIRVAALVALAAILLSAATVLATRQLLIGAIDKELEGVAGRQQIGPSGGRPNERNALVQPGQPIGTIWSAYTLSGSNVDSGLLPSRGKPSPLSSAVVDQLQPLVSDTPTSSKVSVQLGDGLGHYRVVVYPGYAQTPAGRIEIRAVIGISLKGVDDTLISIIGLELILTALAIGGAVIAARAVVLRSLRPLNRVASTAQQVSQLPLDRGEVALAVRVPPEDTDPRSEVGRLGLALNHMLGNVEEALAARQASEMKVRQFVADASHELRNPLAAIRGYAELTRRSGEDIPPDAAYAMSRVESEAERMSRLVEDLLLLARLDAGPALDIRPTDLTELMLNAVSDARAAGPDHVWALSLPDEPVQAMGDTYRLQQVIANLLANARTHTPPGTRVDSSLTVADGAAVIAVTDNGPGIPPDLCDQVFERFTRADTSRVRASGAAQGASTGLGLAIVWAVVDAHQGTVTAESAPGWTRFTVRLPIAEAYHEAAQPLPVGH